MDISATLTHEEVAPLSVPERTCEAATQWLEKAGTQQGLGGNASGFEESLRLKNTLDVFEEQARAEPSWQTLSILLNCEYKLFVLNQNTPLRNNPFLSHWVEAIQRLGKKPRVGRPSKARTTDGTIANDDINTVRAELIKSLLQMRNPSQFANVSPRQLYEDFVELGQTTPFDVATYIRMLEEEGIYEKTPEPEENQEKRRDEHIEKARQNSAARSSLSNFQQWKQDMLAQLGTEPHVAIPELTHLPVELSYLDFLTTLLQEKTLQQLSIEPAPVISDYIQHALRLAEKMGQPPPASGTEADGLVVNRIADEAIDHGREAQTRAVKLLLLFIRNLIRKALLPPEAIYFEIQEICVRYVWIKEVREFRAFIEEGNASGEPGMD